MIQLVIDNSTSQVTGLSATQMSELAGLMSIKIEAWGVYPLTPRDCSRLFGKSIVLFKDAQNVPRPVYDKIAGRTFRSLKDAIQAVGRGEATFQGHWHRSRPLLDRYGRFPSGLLYIADEYFKEKGVEVFRKDNRVPPPKQFPLTLNMGSLVIRPEQFEAAEAAVREHRGIIVAPTGFGKSIVAATIIASLGVRSLLIVPTLALKRQLTEDLRRFLGDEVFDRLVQVNNVDAIDPKKPANVDLVIIDEFHHSGAMTYRELNKHAWKDVYYKFGLTATPFRSQDHERLLLEGVLSKVIYQVTYQKAVSKGYIVPIEAYYIDLPKVAVEGTTWPEVYRELVVKRKDRNEIILTLIARFGTTGHSTLCLVKEIAHGRELSDCGLAFASGVDGNSSRLIEQFNSRALSVLIGTEGVLGEGVDTRPAEVIIIAGLGKSKNAFMQKIGRGFRRHGDKESCKVILFRDASNRWTLDHFRAQCKYLKDEYDVKPVKITLSLSS